MKPRSVIPLSRLNPVRTILELVGRGLSRLGLIDGPRAREISDLAWPRIVTGLARMSKATADVAMVGVALGAPAIAGVGYGVPFWTMAFMLGGGIAGGTISLVSRHYGAGDEGAIATDVKVSAVFAVAATVPLVVLFWFAAEPLIGLLGSDPAAVRYGADYLQVAALAMPFAALNLIGSRALIGAGDAWTPMIVRAGGAVANVGLNAVLIFGFDMGVVGAAVGTVIGNVVGLAAFAVALAAGRFPGVGDLPIRVPLSGPAWNADTARELAGISVPLALRKVAQNGGQFPLLAIVGMLGPGVVAAFVIALRVRALMNTPGWGFGLASSSLVGQSLGAGEEPKASAFAQDTLRFTVSVYVLVGLAVFGFADPIAAGFTSDAEVAAQAALLVRAACMSVVLWGLMNGSMGPLRAGGDTRWPFYGQIIGLFGFALPVAYAGAATSLGVWGLCAALVVETGVPAAVIYARYRTGTWKRVRSPQGAAA